MESENIEPPNDENIEEIIEPEIAQPKKRTWVAYVILTILCVGHFAFLMAHFEPAISAPDANGYLGQAAMIANTGQSWFELETPLQYIGMHWLKTPYPPGAADDDITGYRYFSRYPPGLPFLQAFLYKISTSIALMSNLALSTLTLLGLFFICRLWASAGWALFAVAIMAFNPIANTHSLTHFAHTATAFFFVWGIYFLAKWEQNSSPAWAFTAGLFLGAIPTIRYPEALFIIGCGIFILLNLRNTKRSWTSLAAGIAGLAIPLGALMLRNQLAFGAFWNTGYALTNEQTGFGWNYFNEHFHDYTVNILGSGSGPVCAIGLAGIAAMFGSRKTWRRGLLLVLLILPVTLLYMAYYWGSSRPDATMRFLIPTFFIYPIAAACLLHNLTLNHNKTAFGVAAALIFVSTIWGLPASIEGMEKQQNSSRPLALLTAHLKTIAEPDSVIIANQQVQQHLHFAGTWKLIDESALANPGRSSRRGGFGPGGSDSSQPSPRQQDKEEERTKAYKGLSGNTLTDRMSDDIREWAGENGKIYWVGYEKSIRDFEYRLRKNEKLTILKTIKLPEPPQAKSTNQSMRGGRFGGRTGGRGGFPGGRGGFPGGDRRAGGGPGGPGFMRGLSGEVVIAEWTR